MRKLLLVLIVPSFLLQAGCFTVSLSVEDRERVDKFLVEVKKFNDNVTEIKEAVIPPPQKPLPPKKLAKMVVTNE